MGSLVKVLGSRAALAVTVLLACGMTFVVAGCGGERTPESATEDMVSLLEKQADVLASVKDDDSGRAAVKRLKALAEERKALESEMEAMEEPSAEQQTQMQEKYEKRMEEAMQRTMKESIRLMGAVSPEVGQEIVAAMGD